jgi:hypothetical protein
MLELMSADEILAGLEAESPPPNWPGPIYNLNELGKEVGRRR